MKWTPVKERLPEENINVLVTTKEQELEIAYYTQKEGWHLAFNGYLFLRKPIAWMSLPEPYL